MIVAERGRIRMRVVGVLASGALALAGMAACSSAVGSPGTAAQVGSTRITSSEVDGIAQAFPTSIRASNSITQLRQTAVQWSVFNVVATQYAAAHKIALTPPTAADLQSWATNWGLPADQATSNKAVGLVARTSAIMDTLLKATPTRATTTADYQEVYNELHALGVDEPYAQLAQTIQTDSPQNLGVINDLRAGLTKQANSETIIINPRYQGTCEKAGTPCGGFNFPLASLTDPTTGQQIANIMAVTKGRTTSPLVIDLPSAAG